MKYQEDEIKRYCKEQGWNLIHIFRDEGISGAKLNEEALENEKISKNITRAKDNAEYAPKRVTA